MPERRRTEPGDMHRTGTATAEVRKDGSVIVRLTGPNRRVELTAQQALDLGDALSSVTRYEYAGSDD